MKRFEKFLGILVFILMILLVPNSVNASEMTDNLIKKIAPDGKNVILKSVVPKDDMEADYLMNSIVAKFINPQEHEYYAWCEGDGFTTCIVELWTEDYNTAWDSESNKEVVISGEKVSYTLNATYDVPSIENITMMDKFVSKLKSGSNQYTIEDLSLINYYMTGVKSELWNREAPGRALKFVKELNEITEGSDVNFFLEARMGTEDESLMYEDAYGPMSIFYGDYAYTYIDKGLYLKRVIYIPEDTADTKDAYIVAAQRRIDEYLGKDNGVIVSYGGLLSSLEDDAIDETYEINHDGNYYNIEVLGRNYKFYIAKADESLLVEPTYSGKNIKTDISITSDSAKLPLDTIINAEKLTSGAEYERILGILDLDANVTYDVKLYSNALGDYITKLDDGTFNVKIPVPADLKGKDLVVYYVDKYGNVDDDYTVKPEGDYVMFNTDHFSIYTLGYKEENVVTTNKVTLDANEGKFDDKNIYVIEDIIKFDYTKFDKPTRDGYKFIGFFTGKTDGKSFEEVMNSEAGIDSDMTFYARWEKIETEENPKTYDGIVTSIFMGTISLIGLVGASLYLKNNRKVRA